MILADLALARSIKYKLWYVMLLTKAYLYNRKTFIVHATVVNVIKLIAAVSYDFSH
jgi:hypothetical protein